MPKTPEITNTSLSDQTSGILPIDILSVQFKEDFIFSFEIHWPTFLIILLFIVFIIWILRRLRTKLDIVTLEIPLGGIGKVTLKPNYQDIQIAHKIWTELITRKAAIKIDPQKDVIVEVYNSWYSLFKRIRELISDIPAELVRNSESTKKIIDIATRSLNDGLRPHLTEWQAKFRNWYNNQDEKLKEATPQEIQREFPEYNKLIAEMEIVNEQLIRYAKELKKISEGH